MEIKKISINLNDLTYGLEKLWEQCETHGCHFRVYPKERIIEVHKQDGPASYQLAEIAVVDITDTYDFESTIFNNRT